VSAENKETEQQHGGRHAARDGDDLHPLIDLSRDPNPGRADHARPDKD